MEKNDTRKVYKAHDSINHLGMELKGPEFTEGHDDEDIDS